MISETWKIRRDQSDEKRSGCLIDIDATSLDGEDGGEILSGVRLGSGQVQSQATE